MVNAIKSKFVLEKVFFKSVFALVIPVALQNIISFGVNMMDSVMIGSLGDTAISAAYIGSQPFVFLMSCGFGLSSGGTVLIAQYWGKKDIQSIKRVMRLSMQIVFALSVLIAVVCILFPMQIMSMFSKEADVIALAAGYLGLVAFSYVPYSLANNYMMSLRAVEKVTISAVIYGISFFINVFFNAVFIFGLFGAPVMGVRGAAVGTIIARISELLMVLFYMYNKEKTVNFRIHHCRTLSFKILPFYMRHALPVVGNEILWSIGFIATTAIMGQIGEVFVTANSIATVLQQLALVSVMGVANASAVLTGKTIGEGNSKRAQLIANTFIAMSYLIGVLNCILIWFIRPYFLMLYNTSPQAYAAAYDIMGIMALLHLILCAEITCIVGILRGGGDTRTSFLYDCGALWVISIPAGIITGIWLQFPVPLVYVFLKLDSVFKAILSFKRINSGKWIRNITIDIKNPDKTTSI